MMVFESLFPTAEREMRTSSKTPISTFGILWMSFSRAMRLSESDRQAREMMDSIPGASYAQKMESPGVTASL